MPSPDPHILSSLAAGAAFAAAFLVTNRFWVLTGSLLRRRSAFSTTIRPEPGDDCRRLLFNLDRRVGAHLAAGFVLLSVFAVLIVTGRQPWWSELEQWAWWLVAVALAGAAAWEIASLVRLLRERRRAARELEAHVAVGQRLEHVAARGNFLFHCIPVGRDRVDHIVLGPNGLYAIHVIVRPPVKDAKARLAAGSVQFGEEGETYSLARWQGILRALTRDLERDLGHTLKVMSVVVVPGWDVVGTEDGGHLLVNQSNLPVMTGWRDQRAFLMNEEVETLERGLTKRVTA